MSHPGVARLPRLWSSLISLAALFNIFLPGLLRAQVSTTGKITGVVTDPSGAAVSNATVAVKSPALMADRTSPAQADGSYLFDLLPPGTYELITSAQGFQTLLQTGIVLNAGFTATVNSRLQLGQVQQTISCQQPWRCATGTPRR